MAYLHTGAKSDYQPNQISSDLELSPHGTWSTRRQFDKKGTQGEGGALEEGSTRKRAAS